MIMQAVKATEAWDIFKESEDTFLIDVRTHNEWENVGTPEVTDTGAKLSFISWREGAEMRVNEAFLLQLEQDVPNKDAAVFFMCKAGGRSSEAAVAAESFGYTNCFNIEDGFEGYPLSHDPQNQYPGWKQTLPHKVGKV